MVESPRISIITPSYNHGRFLEQAILSVCDQHYANVEHIVIDGGSTDESLDVIRKYEKKLAYWISEPDRGMYEAINKGLDVATGEIIGFLNSDDIYGLDILKSVVNLMSRNPCDAIAGRAAYYIQVKNGGKKAYRKSNLLTKDVYWYEITYGEPAFNAWFFTRNVFQKIGYFDVSYQIAGDRDFLLRFVLSEFSYFPLEKIAYQYYAHEESLSMTQNLLKFSRIADENLRLVETYSDALPSEARANMQRLRTRDTITAASRSLRGGAYRSAFHYMKVGVRYDKFWPLKFLFRIFTGPFREFGRMLGHHYFKV